MPEPLPSGAGGARYLLDTNAVSALVRDPGGPVDRRARVEGAAALCTSVVVAAELRYGLAKRGASPALARRVDGVLRRLRVLPLEPPADTAYGALRARLEAEGRPIGANDLLVAAHALALGLTVVTDNEREFRRVPGLAVENWLRS